MYGRVGNVWNNCRLGTEAMYGVVEAMYGIVGNVWNGRQCME